MTSEQLFAKVWEAMEDMLGPGATATVLRRAVQLAEKGTPGVRGPMILREGLTYSFQAPAAWKEDDCRTCRDLHLILEQLGPLLKELTGRIVLRRLEQLDALQANGIRIEG